MSAGAQNLSSASTSSASPTESSSNTGTFCRKKFPRLKPKAAIPCLIPKKPHSQQLANLAQRHVSSRHQLQIIRLIRNRLIPKLPHDLRPLQKENPLHLLAVFFDRSDSMLEQRTLKPPHPYRWLKQCQHGMNSRNRKPRILIHRPLRITHPLDISDPVVIEERLRPL